MSRPDETMSLAVWAKTERVLLRAFEYSISRRALLNDKDLVVQTANGWREAFVSWLAEADL